MIKIKKDTLIFQIIIFITILLSIYYSLNNLKYLIIYLFILQIFMIIKYRKNNIIFIFLLFSTSYYLPLLPHYLFNVQLTPHIQNFIGYDDEKTTMLYCIFYIVLLIVLNIKCPTKPSIFINDNIKYIDNIVIFFINIALIIICILFGHNSSAGIGVYGIQGSSSTVLNEYIIIFILIAYICSSNHTFRNCLIWFCFFIYTLINFMYGDRIGVLQVSLLMFYLYLNKYIDYKKILILSFIALQIFNGVGSLRQSGTVDKVTILEENINNNQSQVFNSSITLVKLIDQDILKTEDRVSSMLQYGARIFLKADQLPLGNLSILTQKYHVAQGGGYFPLFFYIWLGVIGVILSGVIIGLILSHTSNMQNQLNTIMLIIIVSVFPRWLAYDPLGIIKMPLYAIIVYYIFYIIHIQMIKKFGKIKM